MKAVEKLLKKMRRQWMLEHFARSGMLVIGLAINAGLVCWLLHRAAGLPLWSLYVVAGLAEGVLLLLGVSARAKAPSLANLAKLADDRAGTEDLFSSALEFQNEPARFGWLGAQTVKQAIKDAGGVSLRSRWAIGRSREWWGLGSAAVVLTVATLSLTWWQGRPVDQTADGGSSKATTRTVVIARTQEEPKPPEKVVADTTPPVVLPEPETQPDKQPDTVKITNEMVKNFLDQMPGQEAIDLTGVTPIRWDEQESSGKNNPQDKRVDGEKIDPVKLDASLLKDLQVAKKTKDETGGGKEGGVDIAVMGNNDGLKAKGDQGGKGNKESLSDAVSKDPRGEASRMAIKPPGKALPIRSVEKLPTREKGEDRPMSPLDFAGAMERMKNLPPETSTVAVNTLSKPEDHVVRQEGVPEPSAALAEWYFDLLRKADR